jgi:hypothetical protein
MTIAPVTTSDTLDIYRIAKENGLPDTWAWPTDCYGGVARQNGRTVAFCAVKELQWTVPTLAIEEFYCEQNAIGHSGLFALGKHMEQIVQNLANERGMEMKIGGYVSFDRTTHAKALKKRGYVAEGEVLTKTFTPTKAVA